MREYQEPTTEIYDGPSGGTIEKHPSYGNIGASRVTGHINLFGSDFTHQAYVAIRIHTSSMKRSLSNDWTYAEDELIEVALSEAQWATFVSAMNIGDGVPCTIQHIGKKDVPQIPEPPKRKRQFQDELGEHFELVNKALQDLKTTIESSNLSGKAKKEMLNHLATAYRNLTPNQKFVADQFGEHMETQIENAKIELAAYMQNAISRAGLTALANTVTPLQLENKPEEKPG